MTARPAVPALAAVLAGVLAVVVAGCSGAAATPSGSAAVSTPSGSAAASPAPSAPPSSPVVGVVLHVDATGLTKVTGFTFRSNAGEMLRFTLGQLEDPTAFPPGHLAEHAQTGAPVRVSFRVEGQQLVVYRLEDAG